MRDHERRSRHDCSAASSPRSENESPEPPACNVTRSRHVLAALLKSPLDVGDAIEGKQKLLAHGSTLLLAAIAFHAVFGLAAGLFGGWQVAIMDVVKAPLVAVCSLLLCFPSLYIFSSVGGSALSLAQAFLLGTSCLAMLGILLIGLAPVAWLFAVSTESVSFMTALILFIWFVAVAFALKYIARLQARALFARAAGIKLWFLVFVIVSLQMVTYLRPMLVTPTGSWWNGEKKFFLAHLADTLEGNRKASRNMH